MYDPNQPRIPSGPHGGEWAGGDASKAIQNAAGANDDKIIQNLAKKIELGGGLDYDELVILTKNNPKLAKALRWVQSNVQFSINNNKFPDDYTKSVFDKMTTKKDYSVFRVDNRFNSSNTKIGDIIDLSDRMYHTSGEISTSETYNQGHASILNIKKGHSLKLGYAQPSNSPGDNSIHMISGKYKVSGINNSILDLQEIR